MLIDIDKIQIKERIRKDFGDIEELANDIKENSLLNPVTVIPAENGMYQLIAGERRLRACKHLEYKQIVVNSVSARDAEQILRMEIAENECRKEFTFSERMDWAKQLERIERIKSKERQGDRNDIVENFPQCTGKTRDIVAEQTGFGSGKQYEKAKFIADHSDEETIKALDEKTISINAAYRKITQQLKDEQGHNEELQQAVRDKDKQIQELNSKPTEKNPPDYEHIKSENIRLKNEAKAAKDEAKAYKQSLETWKGGTKSFEALNLPDFKYAVRKFMGDVTPYVYLGELFSQLKDADKEDYLQEVQTIERWTLDIKQAIAGNAGGANLIVLEGGKKIE